ncbi:MAG: HNH endonuclease [Methylomicrobium sp.]|nr:HNH endonuclease [Methylomicrobium sp.]
MKTTQRIDQATLKSLLEYDWQTGAFTWKERPRSEFKSDSEFSRWKDRYAGQVIIGADMPNSSGREYKGASILGKSYRLHTLAWVYMTGNYPEQHDIIHLNGDTFDNRWTNLQGVTRSERCISPSSVRVNNTSGHTGIAWRPDKNKWTAYIMRDGKQKSLGYFNSQAEAIEARRDAEAKLGFDPLHARRRRKTGYKKTQQ